MAVHEPHGGCRFGHIFLGYQPKWTTAGAANRAVSIRGQKIRELQRNADWLPDNGYSEGVPGEPPLPEYDLLRVDPDGNLWIVLMVRDERWRKLRDRDRRAFSAELYDARLEVIDPMSRKTIASYRRDSLLEEMPPFSRFLRGRRSYRVMNDSSGLKQIEVFDIYLERR